MKRLLESEDSVFERVGRRSKLIEISDSESNVIDLTGSGNTLSVLIVDPIEQNDVTFFQDDADDADEDKDANKS